ncbi:conserved hypothetical protein [Hahella chejuensis KCTC 2396]|uniref:Right handed beta helix domain-containing protein n=1 Tax=Hahella chejuensis (strain KCTC 2396) TaxID=349521 RepID=Q2SFH8_HAHCH|nr:parallel beta-helix domain-containing protein [Hahella chejuensis]ABC30596.1 conserved hypothetical protein [Hahella chejuensis KCTC 2396]
MQPSFIPAGLAPALCLSIAALTGCSSDTTGGDGSSGSNFPDNAKFISADGDITIAIKTAFITAQSGDYLVLPEGRLQITDTLTLDGDPDGDGASLENITIAGYGMDKTILDFSGSLGGDGIFIQNMKDVTVRNLAVEEAANNGIKLKDSDGIRLQYTRTEWKGALTSDNGAYGLYPVECSNILIEDSYVRGSADAGVYVGQSSNIVVRRNVAKENVAGIEIENSQNADVYNNVAEGNTGGILVFDLPIGNHKYGSTVRVFNNIIRDNNTDNFANASSNPAGVHIVPPGTGVIVLSTADVEVYNNAISNHDTTSVTVSSFFIAASQTEMEQYVMDDIMADGWRSVPRNISIHDNSISDSGGNPRGDLIQGVLPAFQAIGETTLPSVLYDGFGELLARAGYGATFSEEPFAADGSENICVVNNGDATKGFLYNPDPTTFTDADPADGEPDATTGVGANLLDCDLARLPAASATVAGKVYGCGQDDAHAACSL